VFEVTMIVIVATLAFAAAAPCNGQSGSHHNNASNEGSNTLQKGGFVASTAFVASGAFIGPAAQVCDSATVEKDARVYGNARLSGEAIVRGSARVYGDAQVSENAVVQGEAAVSGNATISGDAVIEGDALVRGWSTLSSGVISGGIHSAKKPQAQVAAEQAAAEAAKKQAALVEGARTGREFIRSLRSPIRVRSRFRDEREEGRLHLQGNCDLVFTNMYFSNCSTGTMRREIPLRDVKSVWAADPKQENITLRMKSKSASETHSKQRTARDCGPEFRNQTYPREVYDSTSVWTTPTNVDYKRLGASIEAVVAACQAGF
jgi:carbonic anhydrase/acetyltransferase-like protein (isoleucine patch superfamily)